IEAGKSPITPNQITFFRVLISFIILFFIASMVEGHSTLVKGFFKPEFQIAAFLMGFFYYLELIAWFHAVKHIDVSLASSITTPTPVITMILAVVLLKETIVWYQIAAMIVVFFSLYGLLLAGKEKP
ncbi:MAG: DMT family transporter, partial [Spirochaetes bacterium]|nr:DMT family transporter [Spirochaetota bacterium]